MRTKYLVSLTMSLTITFFVYAQNENKINTIQNKNIENIKLHEGELMNNFLLYQEYILKHDEQANIQKRWIRDTLKNELKMIEEDSVFIDESHEDFCFQIWYRSNKKEKIEISIIICSSNKEIDKTVEDFTTKIYSQQFEVNDIPIVGEISWIPYNSGFNNSSYSILFLRANVFARIYANLKEQDMEDLKATVNNIASIIDTRILSEIK